MVLLANNISIGNLILQQSNQITADLSWDNAWHFDEATASGNHDAAYVFVKGKQIADGEWKSIKISDASLVSGDELSMQVAANKVGAIFYLENEVELEKVVSSISITFESTDLTAIYSEVKCFAIEMVYVNEGAFYVGDSASNNCLISYGSGQPFKIESEAIISVGEEEGDLNSKEDFPPAADVPTVFPKGFNAFYAMKYEISQQQYADFLNTLTVDQKQVRSINTTAQSSCLNLQDYIDGERNFIVELDGEFGCDANGNQVLNEADDGNSIPCNFLTWSHLAAYLDWAGLRPMTELEFEKAARGPRESVAKELAWGNANAVNTLQPDLSINDSATILDTIPDNFGIANYGYCLPAGPLRCGFAANATSTRLTSGSSYYGIKELSGNLWEICIVLNADGLNFEGNHGDGELDDNGFANEMSWTGVSGNASGHKGGAWNSGVFSTFNDLAISDRFYVYLNSNNLARGTTGGRGVISASMFE